MKKSAVGLVLMGLALSFAQAATDNSQSFVLMSYMQALRKNAASAQQAAVALSKMGAQAEPAAYDLVEALRYDEEPVGAAAGDALVAIGEPAIKPLRYALGDANFIVRRRAAQILGRFGSQAHRAA